jgi:phenylacetic acid degradation operon negative regulatory protein
VETWRRGEARRVPWSGAWWVVLTPKAPERTAHRRAERALSLVGFARAEPRLWTRPRNLAYERDELEALLAQLGLMDGAELFAASELSDVVERRWKKLWPVADLKRTYRRHAKALEKSMARLERIPRSRALAESFALGGEAIRILATDPMLPEEIQPAAPRVRLFDLMTEYDRIGRDLWQRTLREHGFE